MRAPIGGQSHWCYHAGCHRSGVVVKLSDVRGAVRSLSMNEWHKRLNEERMPAKQRIVAIEEHFWIPELRDRYSGPRGISAHTPARQLDDLGEIRLAEMDTAGIDMQVISHMQPGTQIFDAETAIT